jgi:hypothetical protein
MQVVFATHQSRDRVLELIAEFDPFNDRKCKVLFSLKEIDPERGGKVLSRVIHRARKNDIKLVCFEILNGYFSEWTDHKGSSEGVEPTIATVLSWRKDVKYRQPFVLKIDNGGGERIPGGVKMVNCTGSTTILLPEFDARKLAMTALDYIRDWETVNLRRREEAWTIATAIESEVDFR